MTSARPGHREPARLLLPSERSDVRLSWHAERDVFTLTLWRGGTCIASAPLHPGDAAALASFVVGHLGSRPGSLRTSRPVPAAPPAAPLRAVRDLWRRAARTLRVDTRVD